MGMKVFSVIFVSRVVPTTVLILFTVVLLIIAVLKSCEAIETLGQVQSGGGSSNAQTTGLLLREANATVPAGRAEDIYSIPIEGDIYRISGNVLNNDTARFSSVRVSATLFDSNGRTIGEGSTHTSPSGIQPGATASFEINIFNTSVEGGIDKINNFTLRVDGNRQALTFK